MVITLTKFGRTHRVHVCKTHNVGPDEQYDCVLWIERDEDYYALMSQEYKNKRVVCVHRNDWLIAENG